MDRGAWRAIVPGITRVGKHLAAKPSLPQSLPSGGFHKPVTLLHQRAERLKTKITDN